MKKRIKKTVGWSILLSLLVGLITSMIVGVGILPTLEIIGGTIIVFGLIVYAVVLIDD